MQRFELLGRIGTGANSTVLKCRDTATGAVVAVKKPDGGVTCQQVLHEAAIMRACKHQHCVRLLEAYQGNASGALYLVMEHVEHSLSREILLNPRGLPLPKVKLIVYQLAQALEVMHSKQIAHCDLKPANILLTSHYSVKLCDFGSARNPLLKGFATATDCGAAAAALPVCHPDAMLTSSVTNAAASRWYCAPESLLGGEGTPESDIWALGCIMAELVTGKPLLPGSDEELGQLCCVVAMLGRLSEDQEQLLQLLPPKQRARVEAARAQGPLLERIPKIAASPGLAETLRALLNPDPSCRPSAKQLQDFSFFTDLRQVLYSCRTAPAASTACTLPTARPAASTCGTDCSGGLQLQRKLSSGVLGVDVIVNTAPASPDGAGSSAAASPAPVVAADTSADIKAPVMVSAFAMAAGSLSAFAATIPAVEEVHQQHADVQPTAAATGPAPRPRVSALTATIRGRPFDGDGGYTDLMPAVLKSVARWEEAWQGELLGPIALAARRACSMSSGAMPSGSVDLQMLGGSGFWPGSNTGRSPIATAVSAEEAAYRSGALMTAPLTAAYTAPAVNVVPAAAKSLFLMDWTPVHAPAAVSPSGVVPMPPYLGNTAGADGVKAKAPFAASRCIRPGNAKTADVPSCAAGTASPNVTAVGLSGPSPSQLYANNRSRRLRCREPRSGSVPLSLLAASSSRAGLGRSATLLKQELGAAESSPADARQHMSGSSGHGVRLPRHASRRSFADLVQLASVAECAPPVCETPPDVKRRRGQGNMRSPAASSLADASTLRYGDGGFIGEKGDLQMRRCNSGRGFGVELPLQPACDWQHALPIGEGTIGRTVSLPQPIVGRCRDQRVETLSSIGGGLALELGSSLSSEVVGSQASDVFFRGEIA